MADIHGQPMIVHVWRRALEARVGHVLVAAAENEVAEAIRAQGGDAIVTTASLPSGSDRVAEALKLRDPQRLFKYVVNLQGDLPTIDPLAVKRCLAGLMNEPVDIATLAAPLDDREKDKDHVVKAIANLAGDREAAYARDFVRVLGPDHQPPYWHHIGIYAYKRAALEKFVACPVSPREKEHALEQLRGLDNGMTIAVVRVDSVPLGVDTKEDLDEARRLLKAVP